MVPVRLLPPAAAVNSAPAGDVAAEARVLAKPWSSVKLATTRSIRPTCPAPGTKVAAVAPPMLLQVVPLLDDCHW
ncbi:hypothetical protein D9M68_665900 [compost metagenome]